MSYRCLQCQRTVDLREAKQCQRNGHEVIPARDADLEGPDDV